MNRYEGSHAVQNARLAIIILAWLCFIVGIVLFFIGISDYRINLQFVYLGIALIFSGVLSCISNAILKGFEKITKASEIYVEQQLKNKAE